LFQDGIVDVASVRQPEGNVVDHSSETTNLDQADEEILTYIVSDEALEAEADVEGLRGYSAYMSGGTPQFPNCC
jgi:hypothetical protein